MPGMGKPFLDWVPSRQALGLIHLSMPGAHMVPCECTGHTRECNHLGHVPCCPCFVLPLALPFPKGQGLKVMLLMGAWSQELASLLPAAGPKDSGILQPDDSEACLGTLGEGSPVPVWAVLGLRPHEGLRAVGQNWSQNRGYGGSQAFPCPRLCSHQGQPE